MKLIVRIATAAVFTVALCLNTTVGDAQAGDSGRRDYASDRGDMVDDFQERREAEQNEFDLLLDLYAQELWEGYELEKSDFHVLYEAHDIMHFLLGEAKRAMLQKMEDDYDPNSEMSFNEYRALESEAFGTSIQDLIEAEEENEHAGRVWRQKLSRALGRDNTDGVVDAINGLCICLDAHIFDFDHAKLIAIYDYLGWDYPVHPVD
jgi:hypothetical protein